jgi:hypothetical protein
LPLLRKTLIFFFGSLFYPKDMKKSCRDKEAEDKIDQIHGCLSNFSIAKLDFLYQFLPFRYMLHHFVDLYKDTALRTNSTMSQAASDFEKAFAFLKRYYPLDLSPIYRSEEN